MKVRTTKFQGTSMHRQSVRCPKCRRSWTATWLSDWVVAECSDCGTEFNRKTGKKVSRKEADDLLPKWARQQEPVRITINVPVVRRRK